MSRRDQKEPQSWNDLKFQYFYNIYGISKAKKKTKKTSKKIIESFQYF